MGSTIFCFRCSQRLPTDAVFCSRCGLATKPVTPVKRPDPNRGIKVFAGAVLIFLGLVSIVVIGRTVGVGREDRARANAEAQRAAMQQQQLDDRVQREITSAQPTGLPPNFTPSPGVVWTDEQRKLLEDAYRRNPDLQRGTWTEPTIVPPSFSETTRYRR